ncbi:transposase [Streptomyces sp. AM2-3-1]|uniref:transposase n=1 Tax=Streptomyces sp. AM2-3-1 TaxID=3075824 RepID=UPI0028C46B75|nr:transposase [Streptomyces sp. AM2-3-1]WNO70093.1 transposase [Streptomyces sp. AM2-3-1]
MAEWAGHRDPAALQHLLNGVRWDADAVGGGVRDYAAERLGPGGVLIIDDTGLVKKGTTSAGWADSTPAPRGRSTTAALPSRVSWPGPCMRAAGRRSVRRVSKWASAADTPGAGDTVACSAVMSCMSAYSMPLWTIFTK